MSNSIIESGSDPKLTATETLIAMLEYLGEVNRPYRIVILGVEESEHESFIRFTNARSLAEEVGIITICGKDSARLELAPDEREE